MDSFVADGVDRLCGSHFHIAFGAYFLDDFDEVTLYWSEMG